MFLLFFFPFETMVGEQVVAHQESKCCLLRLFFLKPTHILHVFTFLAWKFQLLIAASTLWINEVGEEGVEGGERKGKILSWSKRKLASTWEISQI